MKTNKTKKNSIKAFIFIALILALSTVSASDENPFHEGTEEVKLTEEEIIELKAYAENTKSILDKALHEAKGKLIHEALLIYRGAIYNAIPQSFEKKKHSELLIRFILNQALDLVDGTPNASGEVREGGVLKNTSNKDLASAIYKNSIDLALSYHSKDMKAISEGTFKNTPYNEMAYQRLRLAKKWAGGVLEQNLKFKFLKRVLEHWLLTVSQKANLQRQEVAHLIVDVQDRLEEVKSYKTTDERIRFLNGVIKRVLEQTGAFSETKNIDTSHALQNDASSETKNKTIGGLRKDFQFQTQTKDNCHGHIKVTFANKMKRNLNCYHNDLLKPELYPMLLSYRAEPQFGCAEGFVKGRVYKIYRSSHRERGGEFFEEGELKCWRKGFLLKKWDNYDTQIQFGCTEGFAEGETTNWNKALTCLSKDWLKSQDGYETEPQYNCTEGFIEGRIKDGKLKCKKGRSL